MAFKLLIECSKDIDKLSIDFSDGTSVIQESPDKSKSNNRDNERLRKTGTKTNRKSNKDDKFLDLDDYDNTPVQSDVVQKPVIQDKPRSVKVAEELQNLDI